MKHEPSLYLFEDVAEELSGPLRRYLERLAGNRATADDLLQETLLKIARGLPEVYRTALVLHDLEGQTAAQVAEIAGCSIATAKIRIHRARRRLKQALDEECRFYRDGENVFRCDRKQDS